MTSLPQTPKRAVLYARVSTQEQVKGFSLRQQLDAMRQYCEREGIDVVGIFEDPAESGRYLERPGLDALRDRVAEGGVDIVLAQDYDRISRMEAWRYQALKAWFQEHGARVRFLEGQEEDDETPMGRFIGQIRQAYAELEREDIRRRMTRGRMQRAREGKILGVGAPTFGYRYNHDRTNYEVNEATMRVVRRIFSMAAEGTSNNEIKRTMERDGIPAPSGKESWANVHLSRHILKDAYFPHTRDDLQALVNEGLLSQSVLATLDSSEEYGIWYYNASSRRRKPDDPKRTERKDKDRFEWVAVPTPNAGIPREVVEKARSKVLANEKVSKSGKRIWELQYFAYCKCGALLAPHNTTRRNGTRAFYYVCNRKRNRQPACEHQKHHRAEKLEKRVRAFARYLLRRPEIIIEQTES